MKKIIIGIIIIAALAVFVMVNQEEKTLDTGKPVIRIGVSLPLTGNVAHVGNRIMKAINLSLADASYDKYQYKLIFENDMHDLKKANTNVYKFISLDKVDALISIWDMSAIFSPKAQENSKVHFTCTFGKKAAEGKYNFNNYTQIEEHFKVMYAKMKKENIKNIAFVIGAYAGSVEQVDALEELFKDTDIKVVAREEYVPGSRDFRVLIQKLENKHDVDVYYTVGVPPEQTIFVKQYKEVTGKKNVISIDSFREEENKELFNDMWYVESSFGDEEFIEKFEKETGESIGPCSANLYDALSLLIHGYENTPTKNGNLKPSNEDVINTILELKEFNGAMGKVEIDKDGIIQSKASVKTIIDGKVEMLEE